MAAIGNRILELIKERGMTQKEFSLRTGIPQSTISDWKGKGLNPNVDKVMVICDVLDMTPEDLLGTETRSRNRRVGYICIDENSREYRIVVEYRKLDSTDKARLEGYLSALSRKNERDEPVRKTEVT